MDASDSSARLLKIHEHFATLKSTALAKAREVLGEAFNPEDRRARDNLEASVRPAIEQLSKHIGELPSIARLSALSVSIDEASAVLSLLSQISAEAATLAELAVNPALAQRSQLYARVSAWMHEHHYADRGKCPVCIGSLDGACDPVTGDAVSAHLVEGERDREIVAKTVAEWSSHWCGRLLQDLPPSIAKESRGDLPASPAELLRGGLVDELFGTESFRGALSALRADASALVTERIQTLPLFEEPDQQQLPPALGTGTMALQKMVNRTMRALAFAEWRRENADGLNSFLYAVRRGQDGDVDADRAIGRRLSSLLSIIEGVAPLNTAIEHIRRLESARLGYTAKQARIVSCSRAATALRLLVPLGELAQAQVETLRTKLHNRSEYWRRAMYRNATSFAPDLVGTGMDARGMLELQVGRDGVTAPAQHVFNASALRGALLGFFLAFREHVLATRGGLSLLVLDDPQELLDNDNRERFARGLARVAETGAQLFVTTHDRKFARSLVAENRADDRIEHLSVHPVNAVRPTLTVAPAIEEVDRKRQEFHANPDSALDAQNYASDLRVFLETRLGDLFDDIVHPAYAAPTKALTLIPLMDKLRGLVSSGTGELFINPVVKRFAEDAALREGAEPRRVLNQSHHNKAAISYMDVKAVEADFARLRTEIEKVHEQFRLHRWREPLLSAESGATVARLPSIAKPAFSVPIYPDIAAFVGQLHEGESQDVAVDRLDGEWFEGKALFYVRGDTLGFAIPGGAVAIVDAEPYAGRDQNMVIARHKSQVLARRLVTSRGAIGVSLAAQMPDPRILRPTLTFDESKLRLHRIVGAIFTDMPPPVGAGEATPINSVPELDHVAVAYRVREGSAIPLALPGQIILGGAELTIVDLDRWENRVVAVTLGDGTSILKRVGARLPGGLGYLRQFETIGGLGSSIVIATEATDGVDVALTMVSARKVIGVLYD
ncbi:hypothetical protein [Bradyrhizobium sp. CCBAU 51745]|uniref:hypothetical protein n=1 Tax=Bradyrhizobium sp. CCBAU 51745 TaxID=1325099 RepID=UPI002305B6E2|nr:hypothetical protein [Bradyrhizobium sp. CCBAU 51745]